MQKRILLMTHKMHLGGTEKALLSFINALQGKNVSVTLQLLESGGKLFDRIPEWVNVEILEEFEKIKPLINEPPLHLIKENIRRFKWVSAIRGVVRYAKVKITGSWYFNYIEALKRINTPSYEKFDIAVAFAGPDNFISYYIYKCVNASEKIQWIHFDIRKVIFKKNFGNKYYKYFDKIFCVSENAKLVFDEMFPQYVDKTAVFKNIISASELEKEADAGETFSDDFDGVKIVTLGRLSKEKGQQMIPEIVAKLRNDQLKFRWYLIGDGQIYEEIKEQISTLGITKELILLGSKKNPYRYVKDCDLYVQTSFHEGYCLTVHEAKIFNKPVVVTNVASATNLIVHNEDGLIVDISIEGIYEGVKTLLQNKEQRVSFKRNLLLQETETDMYQLDL